jgi:uncharacterized protein YndB with AHSA1/START domain
MVSFNQESTFNAPLEKIFDYVSKPSNLPEIWPSLVEISNEQPLPHGGYSFNWLRRMGGVFLEGTGKYTDIAPNQWCRATTVGAVDSSMTWTFRSLGHQTRVTLTIDHHIPIPVLGWLAEVFIAKASEHEAELMMANLRAKFKESRPPLPGRLPQLSESIVPSR